MDVLAEREQVQEQFSDVARSVIDVAIVNDFEIIVRGLAAMLAPFEQRVRVVELDVNTEPHRRAHVALFDSFASKRNTLERAATLVDSELVDHVVLYTWDASIGFLQRAAEIGVAGVLSKAMSAAEIVDYLEGVVTRRDATSLRDFETDISGRRTRAGKGALSEREREVLALMSRGLTNAQIADDMMLSLDTVKTYAKRLYRKLGVNNRTQAALIASTFGFGNAPSSAG